jgi:hypothetical protein
LETLEAPFPSGLDEKVERAMAQAERFREGIAKADPARVRGLFREMVSRIELFFNHREEARRGQCSFSRGVIYVRDDVLLNTNLLSSSSSTR